MSDPRGSAEEKEAISRSAAIRRLALTPEERKRRDEVAKRTEMISKGVKKPASGVFGRAKAS